MRINGLLPLFGGLFIFQVAAQTNITDLPGCGRQCFENMSDLVSSLGCEIEDKECVCTNRDFGMGMQDCVRQSCPPTTNFRLFAMYGIHWCGDYFVVNASSTTIILGFPTSTPATDSSTTAQGQVTPASTASADAQTADEENDPGASGGLSSGGKIGLAIAMAVLGTVVIAGTLVFCGHHKRKQKDAERNLPPNMTGSTMPSDKGQPEVYRGGLIPVTPNGRPKSMAAQQDSPISRQSGPPKTPTDQYSGSRPSAFAELSGEKSPRGEMRPARNSMHELPSPR